MSLYSFTLKCHNFIYLLNSPRFNVDWAKVENFSVAGGDKLLLRDGPDGTLRICIFVCICESEKSSVCRDKHRPESYLNIASTMVQKRNTR